MKRLTIIVILLLVTWNVYPQTTRSRSSNSTSRSERSSSGKRVERSTNNQVKKSPSRQNSNRSIRSSPSRSSSGSSGRVNRSSSNGNSRSSVQQSSPRRQIDRSTPASRSNTTYKRTERSGNTRNSIPSNGRISTPQNRNADRNYNNNNNRQQRSSGNSRSSVVPGRSRSEGSSRSSVNSSRSRSANDNRPSVNSSRSRSESSNIRRQRNESSSSRSSANIRGNTTARSNYAASRRRIESNNRGYYTYSSRNRAINSRYVRVNSPVIVHREVRVVHHYIRPPRPIAFRRVYYPYRVPVNINIVWTNRFYNDFVSFYPYHTHWNYRRGYRIPTISAYDAMFHVGEVRRVYGRVSETYYSQPDDSYYLYIGAPYPYQDFTVIIPGREFRRFNFPSLRYLQNANIWALGLISAYDDVPEVVIKRPYQLEVY